MSGQGPRPDLLRAGGLFLAFFLLYAGCGLAFQRSSPLAFAYLDQLFDADVPSRIIDLTRFSGPHHRTQFHPLFVLLLNPPGVALKTMLRALGVEQAGRLAAILMCASAGGAGVCAFLTLLRRSGLAGGVALAWSLVFGFSSSQWFFSVFPESYVFSALTLLVLFGLEGGPRARLSAGVLAFGMNVVNLAAVALARAAGLDWTCSQWTALRALTRHLLVVLAVTGALSLVQTSLYEDTAPFWRSGGLGRDDRLSFIWPREPGDVAARGRDLVACFFFWNLAAPRTVVTRPDPPRAVVDFPPVAAPALRPAGVAHGLLWGALLILATRGAARSGAWRRPLVIALGLWVLLLAALHVVFGTSLFLYSGQWTFAVLAIFALLFGPGPGEPGKHRAVTGAVLLLAALQVLANADFLVEIARAFA